MVHIKIPFHYNHVPVITCRLYFIQLWYILKYLSSVRLPRQETERGGQSDIVTFREKRESLDTFLGWCVYTELLNLYCIVDLK